MDIKTIDKNMIDNEKNNSSLKWYNNYQENFQIHGLYWFNQNNSFCRLREKATISDNVNQLAYHPSGAFLSFMTDSSSISLRITLSSAAYMSHMSACGQCGLDLYFWNGKNFVFLATTKINKAEYEITMIDHLPQKMRYYRLYLPTYTKLINISVGVNSQAQLKKWGDFYPEAIVCYGTSITQGGCVTRPGMSYPSILGRNIEYEVYNLGFSGSAKLEQSISQEIATIKEMKYLIIEAEANCEQGNILEERLPVFIDTINQTNKGIKIFVISHYPRPDSLIKDEVRKLMKSHANIQKNICKKHPNVEFVDGKKLLKKLAYEETVDGIHLTDLGFYEVAKYFSKKLKKKND